MRPPSLIECKTPRLLQKYLAKMARKASGEDPTVTFKVDDDVVVLDDGEKYPDVVTKVHGDGTFDVDFTDGDDGCYSAEDFC